ncbi:MAG: PA0069 family radical SAM protein [Rhodoferax sp.]
MPPHNPRIAPPDSAPTPPKGRGSAQALPHRFVRLQREPLDDGWQPCDSGAIDGADDHGGAQGGEGGPGPMRCPTPAQAVPTQWRWEEARSALTRNRSPDIPFELSLNPYRGCEHGCAYCFARPTHGYLDLSPGLDFETRLVAKRNIAALLRAELSRPGYRPTPIAIGTVTDAYQPLERRLGLTRACLQVLLDARHPVAMVTKGVLVERDLDLWAALARDGLAGVYVTITTLDKDVAHRLEPRAPSPARRLAMVAALARAGVPVGVSLSPHIPFITDDLEQVLAAAAQAGARRAFCIPLRLPWEVAPLFQQWLQHHYPERAERVMARVRDLHGGRDNEARFGWRMRGQGVWGEVLHQRFHAACRRWGMVREYEHERMPLALFRPPGPAGQGQLF